MSGVYVLPYVIFLSGCSGAAGVIMSKTGRYQEMIWGGCALMALGYGLLVRLTRTSSWAELIIFQIIAGAGAGPLFQAPLIAIHAVIVPVDIGTATSTFAFLRTLGTALAISLGLVVFQSAMAKQAGPVLTAKLGADVAAALTGGSASASIESINRLQGAVRVGAQDVYANGMRAMWWFFTAVAVMAFVSSLGIGKHHLSRELNSVQPAIKKPKKADRPADADLEKAALSA